MKTHWGRIIAACSAATTIGGIVFFAASFPQKFRDFKQQLIADFLRPDSPEVSWIYDDWCGAGGFRQRFARQDKQVVTQICQPSKAEGCDEPFITGNSRYVQHLGKFEINKGRLFFRATDIPQPTLITHLRADLLEEQVQGTADRAVEMYRCSSQTAAPIAPPLPTPPTQQPSVQVPHQPVESIEPEAGLPIPGTDSEQSPSKNSPTGDSDKSSVTKPTGR